MRRDQDTAFRVIKTNRTTAVAQMIDGYQIIVVAGYDESTSLLQALGALAARIHHGAFPHTYELHQTCLGQGLRVLSHPD